MPRRRIPPARFLPLLRQAAVGWVDDGASSMGAALAYYTLFSIAPLLLLVIAVAGLAFGEEAARGEIMGQIAGLVGPPSARAIEQMLAQVHLQRDSSWAAAAGLVALVVGATSVFAELQQALDRIWRGPAARPPAAGVSGLGGLWALVRTRLLSLGIILGLGFLSMVSLIFNAALSAFSAWWTPWFGGAATLARALDFTLGFVLTTVMFAMLYKWVPRARVAWRDVWVGAALTALLFGVGKWLIGLYLGHSRIGTGFGAAASLVVLMIWVYWSAQIFLLGAELTWAYAHRPGVARGEAVGDGAPPA